MNSLLRTLGCLLALVFGVPAVGMAQPVNNDCADALPISAGDTAFSTVDATTDGTDLVGFCDMGAFGDDNAYNDVWYTFTATIDSTIFVATCGNASYDTRIAAYQGTI